MVHSKASESCVNSEMRQRIQDDCFSKHLQLNEVLGKCLHNGRCDDYSLFLNCVLNESRKVRF